ncbi:NTP transferase domain-containing protein [Lysobacter sp. 5GHs7-4]|uniref:molybdenum cofactor guanylyltransferase n=1 Tax=Lysobacter sp. 5GHs7-4 TaxID=2904253 RepID=UPI001E3DAF35|nr:NTP transferase domain-containing protein [Lysobacter sp. 5GHs7-4]UHQ21390.1 NTP transferase domain-containing protein [Lysobacter sp. 5GHs7-4]
MQAAAPTTAIPPSDLTLGLLAGGRASRLGGLDKAWLLRDGQPQVLSLAQRYAAQASAVLVSANRDPDRYAAHGLRAVPDLRPDLGPLGGLQALATACATPWLLTLPVDALDPPEDLLARLSVAGAHGACAIDADGVQPLFALWRVVALRPVLAQALAHGRLSVQALQTELGMARVRCDGLRFGNLNTREDLAAAGIDAPLCD